MKIIKEGELPMILTKCENCGKQLELRYGTLYISSWSIREPKPIRCDCPNCGEVNDFIVTKELVDVWNEGTEKSNKINL